MIATGRKYRYRFATGAKLVLFKYILLSSILVNNRVIVIENRQKNFQLQLQQNHVINYNFVNHNYNISKPGCKYILFTNLPFQATAKGPFSLRAKLPPAHLSITQDGGYASTHCPFNC